MLQLADLDASPNLQWQELRQVVARRDLKRGFRPLHDALRALHPQL